MPATFDRELRRILTRTGCQFVRLGKGSHEIWYSPITNRRFVLPAAIVSRHTANGSSKTRVCRKPFDRGDLADPIPEPSSPKCSGATEIDG
jgi:predicted RNA binding protein YcfA (HicA-like mRNA interferase family)